MIEQHKAALPSGEITLVTITGPHGEQVTLSSLGAGIITVNVPDRNGRLDNVAMTYGDLASYLGDGPCCGKTPGRYANRIGYGRLRVGEKDYQLAVNCGPHHLHGGPDGFQNQIWDVDIVDDRTVRFSLNSPDGHENYPGAVEASVTYRLGDDGDLTITYEARSDAPTVINLTNHTYFNLNGATAGCALDHVLRLFSSHYVATDPTLLPLGTLAPVDDTPMDFRRPRTLRSRIHDDFEPLRHGKGYDHCFVIDRCNEPGMHCAAILSSPLSGRVLTITTDQPGMQLYTGNWLTGSPLGPGGHEYHDYDCVAIECQGFPDAPNRPEFPSQELTPGRPYRRHIIYRFTVS